MELDSWKAKGLRAQLVRELESKGITNSSVLKVIGEIPRHIFLDNAFVEIAYEDKAFPIGEGQTISQPYTVARQTELLDIQPSDIVLEIGTGSGYQAAVLAKLCKKVFSIERQEALYQRTKAFLSTVLNYRNIRCSYGDGFEGNPTFAPYDKILITAAAPEIPVKLLQQLKVGGYLVIPFGEGDVQTMLRITRINETQFSQEEFGQFSFVPMLKGKSRAH